VTDLTFSNSSYRRLDRLACEKGWGDYPARWHEFWLLLKAHVDASDLHIHVENPLILGGSVASLISKRHRFIGHLLVAEAIGKLSWATDYLDNLEPAEWEGVGLSHSIFPEQKEPILYITGRGGSLDYGYASVLKERCLDFDGIEVNGDFLKLRHIEQMTVVAEVLKQYCDHTIIANSYGAYLVLCVLVQSDIQLNNVFLHSPVTGSATLQGTYFRPAGAKALENAIEKCNFAGGIKNLSVVVGSDDIQCDPQRCQLMAAAFHGRATVIPNQAHRISPNKLEKFTDEFLRSI